MSSMKNTWGERGSTDVLLVSVILLALLFIGAAGFGFWAFTERQDYKNNVDAKVADAQDATKKQVQATDAKQYAEAAKNPLKTYSGPDAYGSVKVQYPKTWSLYVDAANASTPVDAYFHTDYVPSVAARQTYNLRVRVVANSYDAVSKQYAGAAKTGKVSSEVYTLPKLASVQGVKLTGQILPSDSKVVGVMVLLPIRDKTLQVWIESASFLPDFTTYILPNLTFAP